MRMSNLTEPNLTWPNMAPSPVLCFIAHFIIGEWLDGNSGILYGRHATGGCCKVVLLTSGTSNVTVAWMCKGEIWWHFHYLFMRVDVVVIDDATRLYEILLPLCLFGRR
jgi:hypothetical protein